MRLTQENSKFPGIRARSWEFWKTRPGQYPFFFKNFSLILEQFFALFPTPPSIWPLLVSALRYPRLKIAFFLELRFFHGIGVLTRFRPSTWKSRTGPSSRESYEHFDMSFMPRFRQNSFWICEVPSRVHTIRAPSAHASMVYEGFAKSLNFFPQSLWAMGHYGPWVTMG